MSLSIIEELAERINPKHLNLLLILTAGFCIYQIYENGIVTKVGFRFLIFLIFLVILKPISHQVFQIGKMKSWGDHTYEMEGSPADLKRIVDLLVADNTQPFSKKDKARFSKRLQSTFSKQTATTLFEWEVEGQRVPARFFIKRLGKKHLFVDVSGMEGFCNAFREAHHKVAPHEANIGQLVKNSQSSGYATGESSL